MKITFEKNENYMIMNNVKKKGIKYFLNDNFKPTCNNCYNQTTGEKTLTAQQASDTGLLAKQRKQNKKSNTSQKKTNYLSWTDYFISLAQLVSQRSKDPQNQVGAIIVNPQSNTIISTGYNGFPRGCSDDEFPWSSDSKNWLETKYPYVVHAEANAIIHAQRSCKGYTMYTNFFPCHECTKLIIQIGIKNVFYYSNSLKSKQWQNSYLASEKMFKTSGVNYQKIKT